MNQSGINETKNNNNNSITDQKIASKNAMEPVIDVLKLIMPITMAKRLICVILIFAGLTNKCISDLADVSERTIRRIRKQVASGNVFAALFAKKHKVKGKLLAFAEAIIYEINNTCFFTRLQIVEMIKEKFFVNTSLSAVGRFLKNTASSA
jgi:transposase